MSNNKKKLKILLLGGVKPWSIFNIYLRKYRKLGHEIEVVDLTEVYSISFLNRLLNVILTRLGMIPVYFGSKNVNEAVIKKAKKLNPDLVVFYNPVHIFKSTVKRLKNEFNSVVFAWTTDATFYNKNISRPFLRTISLFDCHFTINSSCIPDLKEKGAKKVILTPPAADPDVHFPAEVSEEEKERLGADLVFVGTYADDKRAEYLEKLCKDGYDVKVYGNSWDRCLFKCSCLKENDCLAYRPVYIEEMSKVFNSSKVVLAFLRAHNKDKQTTRTYEIPACKAFMLHQRTGEATDIFEEGKEASFFDGYEELKEKINYYLSHPEERKKIAENGYKRVQKRDCSYEARVETILDAYYDFKKNNY